MVASSKLFVAALCLGQAAGKKNERKLRGEDRSLQVPMQFVGEEPIYDDYFGPGPSDGVVEAGQAAQVDDFFSEGTGLNLGWTTEEESDGMGSRLTGSAKKSGKFGKVSEAYATKNNKGGAPPKTGKSGKYAKKAGPPKVTKVKNIKNDKGGKNGKNGRGVYPSKSSKSQSPDYSYESETVYYGGDSFTETESTGDYSNLFYFGNGRAGDTEEDDYFNPDGRVEGRAFNGGYSSTGSSVSYGSANSQQSAMTFDDDFWTDDEVIVFLPRPTVTLSGQAFSVNPQTILPPVVPDGSGNSLTLGTEYLFNELTTNAQNINSQLNPVQVDNEEVAFFIALDGYCDRIGPQDQNSVQGYCFFTYTLIDPATQLKSGSFTAQGIIVNSQVPGQLTVTGGTGILTGATGLVEILPASVDSSVNPPLLVQPPEGSDPFNAVAGWAHFFEFDVDVLFFLPELYASR